MHLNLRYQSEIFLREIAREFIEVISEESCYKHQLGPPHPFITKVKEAAFTLQQRKKDAAIGPLQKPGLDLVLEEQLAGSDSWIET